MLMIIIFCNWIFVNLKCKYIKLNLIQFVRSVNYQLYQLIHLLIIITNT